MHPGRISQSGHPPLRAVMEASSLALQAPFSTISSTAEDPEPPALSTHSLSARQKRMGMGTSVSVSCSAEKREGRHEEPEGTELSEDGSDTISRKVSVLSGRSRRGPGL